MIQVRDLLEHLQTFPPEMRLEFVVQTIKGPDAAADNYRLARNADVIELTVTGALVYPPKISE